ncbi:MAG: DMT family transporter [Flavobacteriales bacterium]|nr:DMT family transporter [Flavobacteriales bacterium]MBL0046429.1 DMT family transporter [Flavobacteriales bacterium]
MSHARRNALILLHFTVFLWGWTGIFGKLIHQGATQLVFTRTFIALVGLASFALFAKRSLSWRTPDLKQYALVGVLIVAHWVTFYGSIKVSTASIGAACLATSTMFTALLEPFWFHRKIRTYEVVLGAVVMGALLLMFGLETEFRLGIALGILSSLLSAWFNIVNGVLVKRDDPVRIGFYELLCVMLLAAAWLIGSGESPQLPWQLPTSDLLYQLVLGLVCTTFAFVSGIAVMKQLSPFTVVLAVNLEPVYTILIALIIWGEGERMHAGSYAGIALILSCLMMNGWLQRRERLRQEATQISPIQ